MPNKRVCRECSTPDRPVRAKGLCNRCYMRGYMREYNARPDTNYALRNLKSSFNAFKKKNYAGDLTKMNPEDAREHVAKWQKGLKYYLTKIHELEAPILAAKQREPADLDKVKVVKIG